MRHPRNGCPQAPSYVAERKKEVIVKHNIRFISLVSCFASVFVLGIVPSVQAQAKCSNASLKGSFGVTSTGTIVGVGPLAALGVVTFDGEGNHTGFDDISINGSISRGTFNGTYKVNPDCTGSDIENFEGGPIIQRNFVIVDNGREIRFIVTNPGNAVTAVAKKQSPAPQDHD